MFGDGILSEAKDLVMLGSRSVVRLFLIFFVQ